MDTEEVRDIASKENKHNTTNETLQAILLFLSQCHKNGGFVKGTIKDAIEKGSQVWISASESSLFA